MCVFSPIVVVVIYSNMVVDCVVDVGLDHLVQLTFPRGTKNIETKIMAVTW